MTETMRIGQKGEFAFVHNSRYNELVVSTTDDDRLTWNVSDIKSLAVVSQLYACGVEAVAIAVGDRIKIFETLSGEHVDTVKNIGNGRNITCLTIFQSESSILFICGLQDGSVVVKNGSEVKGGGTWTLPQRSKSAITTIEVISLPSYHAMPPLCLALGDTDGKVSCVRMTNPPSSDNWNAKEVASFDAGSVPRRLIFDWPRNVHGNSDRLPLHLWVLAVDARSKASLSLSFMSVGANDVKAADTPKRFILPEGPNAALCAVPGHGVCACHWNGSRQSCSVSFCSDFIGKTVTMPTSMRCPGAFVGVRVLLGSCVRGDRPKKFVRFRFEFLVASTDGRLGALRTEAFVWREGDRLAADSASKSSEIDMTKVVNLAIRNGAPCSKIDPNGALDFMLDNGFMGVVTRAAVREKGLEDPDVIAEWAANNIEMITRQLSDCKLVAKELVEAQRRLFDLRGLLRGLVEHVQANENISKISEDQVPRMLKTCNVAYLWMHRAIAIRVMRNICDESRLQNLQDVYQVRRAERGRLFITRILEMLDAGIASKPKNFPPRKLSDLIDCLFDTVGVIDGEDDEEITEQRQRMTTVLFVLMYVAIDCCTSSDRLNRASREFVREFLLLPESLSTVIQSLWRLDAGQKPEEAGKKLLNPVVRPVAGIATAVTHEMLKIGKPSLALNFVRTERELPKGADEQLLATRVYLECGLWQEALFRIRDFVCSAANAEGNEVGEKRRTVLLGLLFEKIFEARRDQRKRRSPDGATKAGDEMEMDEPVKEPSLSPIVSVMNLPLNREEHAEMTRFLMKRALKDTTEGGMEAADMLVSLKLKCGKVREAQYVHERHAAVMQRAKNARLWNRITMRAGLIQSFHAAVRSNGTSMQCEAVRPSELKRNEDENVAAAAIPRRRRDEGARARRKSKISAYYSPGVLTHGKSPLVTRSERASRRVPTPYVSAGRNRAIQRAEHERAAESKRRAKTTPHTHASHDLRTPIRPVHDKRNISLDDTRNSFASPPATIGMTRSGRRFRE